MFENARLKLTAWYLVIIMAISVFFSFAIYSSVTQEFKRFENVQLRVKPDGDQDEFPNFVPRDRVYQIIQADPEFIENARTRVKIILFFINIIILGLSGAAGYFLAGRTLRPIKKMVEEQKRFISDASHELRTPLTALRTEIEVGLRNKKMTIGQAGQLLKSNLEEVITLQKLSDNLLELAQNGQLINKKNMKEVSLRYIITEAVKRVSSLAKKKEIVIKEKIKDTEIVGIEDRLVEAFIILLDNAIKYSSKKGTVTIETSLKKNAVLVSVTDQGIGIAEKDVEHVFDRFFRADSSRSRISGYGLGLSIAKKIVDSHDGKISVTSKVGKGTKFVISFPARKFKSS